MCGIPTTPRILDCLSVRCVRVRRMRMRGGGAERDLKSEVLWVRVFEVMQRVRTAKGASASTRDRARARACGSVGGRDDRIMLDRKSVV